jgi:(p)ppGpp synthase/HD superfamily hydrolase
MHADQRRALDRAPFVLHPLEVASLLNGRGFDDEVLAAGVLHDVVENTAATVEDVASRFGERVAEIVDAVSEDPAISDYAARKAALRERARAGGIAARAVYAADKISKARELRSQAAGDPSVLSDAQNVRKLEHYERSLAMLREAGDGQPMVDQLAFELWALRALPPEP